MAKTILITISRGGTARNILQSDVYNILKKSGHRLIILTPAYQDERFLSEFSSDNVYFEDQPLPNWSKLDHIFVALQMALIYNHSIELWDKHGIYDPKEGNPYKYLLKKIIFLPLSKLKFLRDILRWFDKILVKDTLYNDIFDKYKPDLVFSTSVMEDADVFVLKQAQQRNIPTIGMVKTWDNTSKMSFRAKVDKLIVWSDYVKDESLRFQNYKKNNIIICGIPQFDFYIQKKYIINREEFFRSIGADPNKKLIVFGSEGKISSGDGQIAEIMVKGIEDGSIRSDAQLFIRPHFMYIDDEKKFNSLKNNLNVIIDKEYNHSKVFKDNWDYSNEQIKRFSAIMRYADIVITSASTLILDAASYDKPIIAIAFDGYEKKPFKESIAKWYLSEYQRAIIAQNGLDYVENKENLINSINNYLKDSSIKSDGRKKLRDYFCYKIDGRSGERIANAVLDCL